MANKKTKFLKNLLTTASALAVIAGGVENAMAAQRDTVNANSQANNAGHWNPAVVTLQDGDHIRIGNANDGVIFNIANLKIKAILGNGNHMGALDVAEDVFIGSITGGAGNAGNLIFSAAKTLTLIGGDNAGRDNHSYAKLADIDFGGAAGRKLVIDTGYDFVGHGGVGNKAGIALAGEIANGGNGALDVNTNLDTNHGSWGTIKTINIGTALNARTLKMAANGADLNLITAADAKINFVHEDSILDLTIDNANGGAIQNNGVIGGKNADGTANADLRGRVKITGGGGGASTFTGGANTSFGAAPNARLISLELAGNQNLIINTNVYAKDISLNITGGGDITFQQIVNTAANGKMKIDNAAVANVILSQDSTIGTFDFNNEDKLLKVAAGKTLTGNINGHEGGANIKGTLQLVDDAKWNGIATNLKIITAGSAGNTGEILGAGDHIVEEIRIAANNGTIKIADGVRFTDPGGLGATGRVNEGGGASGILELAGTAYFGGQVGNNAVGQIQIKGGVGKTVTFVKNVTTNGADGLKFFAAGGTAELQGNYTGSVLFHEDGVLKVSGNDNHTITGNITITPAADGKGTIEIDASVGTAGKGNRKIVTFAGQVGNKGADNEGVKLLTVNSQFADVTFNGNANVHIRSLELNGDSTIKLDKAGGFYRFGGITVGDNNTNTIEINQDMTFVGAAAGAAVNFGESDNRLKSLKFTDAKTLNVEDGINIYATDVTNTGVNHGIIDFKGSSIFDAPIAAGRALNQIKLGADNKTVKIVGNIKTNGTIEYQGTGTFEFAGTSLEAVGGINPNGKAAKLKFTNQAAATVPADIAVGLAEVEFAGQNVTFTGNFQHGNDIKFSSTDEIVVEFTHAATNIGNNKIINSSQGKTQTVKISAANTDFTNEIGVDNPVNIMLNGNIVAKVMPNANEATAQANVGFITTGQAELKMNKAGAKIRSVGTSTAAFAKLTFDQNGEIVKDVYATNIEVTNDRSATFGGVVKGTNLKLLDEDAEAIFKDGATVETDIVSIAGNNKGYATFQGSAVVANKIGADNARLKSVEFADGANFVTELRQSIYAEDITFGAGNVNVTAPVTLDGKAKFTNSVINLGTTTLQSSGGSLNLTGTPKITTSITQNSAKDLVGGKIVVNSSSTLSYNGLTGLTVKIEGSTSPNVENRSFNLIDNTAGADVVTANKLNPGNIKLVFDEESLSTWKAGLGPKGGIVLTLENNVVGGITESFKKAGVTLAAEDSTNLGLISKGTGDAEKLVDALSSMSAPKRVETLQRLSEAGAPETVEAVKDIVNTVSNAVSQRMVFPTATVPLGQAIEVSSAGQHSGVAAGDDDARYGIWANPFFGKGTQKARGGASGYKSDKFGASFGFDTKANDDMVVGAALSRVDSKVKHKDKKKGDTTKISSTLLSIYGLQQFTDNWFGQGIVTVGSNSISNNEGRVLNTNTMQTAKGKYNSMSFSGEVMAGYNYVVDQVMLTPMAGLRFTRVNDGGYKETGTNFQNLDISKKASNKFELIAGARLSSNAVRIDLNDVSIVPELHGFVNYDTIAKSPEVSARMSGVSSPLATKSAKPQKASYNVGIGANIRYGKLEYSAGYDANFSDKYVGHEGSVRVRVNF